ncbi:6931_t:CDS:1, partial [Dentiscutata heterogama]
MKHFSGHKNVVQFIYWTLTYFRIKPNHKGLVHDIVQCGGLVSCLFPHWGVLKELHLILDEYWEAHPEFES